MKSAVEAFEEFLREKLIPEFCSDAKRGLASSSFQNSKALVGEQDAEYFLRAIDAELISHKGRGLYIAPRSAHHEQFFWEGPVEQSPRTFSLWHEPIITVSALARLHFDYGWPKNSIGTQSKDGAFDLMAYTTDSQQEHIAAEIKKTRGEIDQLIVLMEHFGLNPHAEIPVNGKKRNAFKKIQALRLRKAPIFWALGPNGYSKIFNVLYYDDNTLTFEPTENDQLRFCNLETSNDDLVEKLSSLNDIVAQYNIFASDGSHSGRLHRVILNLISHTKRDIDDDRLLHLMSRIGVLSRSLARDTRSGFTSKDDVANILDLIADAGDVCFDSWRTQRS